MKRAALMVACMLAAALCRPAQVSAQAEPRVLVLDDFLFQADYSTGVWTALGRRPDRYTESFVSFMEYLTEEEWDYVVFVYYELRSREEHEALAVALEEHLSRGGTLSFTYPRLDEAPELWEVLQVASAVDPAEPEDVVPSEPWHPMWLGSAGVGAIPPLARGDFGDVLEPAGASRVIGLFQKSGLPAIIESRGGQVLVNGAEWDDYGPAIPIGRAQTMYLTTCIPDFDDNGVLDFFDFLAFQDAFAAGDPRAHLRGAGSLTFFDFLAFHDVFAYGCPRH